LPTSTADQQQHQQCVQIKIQITELVARRLKIKKLTNNNALYNKTKQYKKRNETQCNGEK